MSGLPEPMEELADVANEQVGLLNRAKWPPRSNSLRSFISSGSPDVFPEQGERPARLWSSRGVKSFA